MEWDTGHLFKVLFHECGHKAPGLEMTLDQDLGQFFQVFEVGAPINVLESCGLCELKREVVHLRSLVTPQCHR